jgi:thioredoxin 1
MNIKTILFTLTLSLTLFIVGDLGAKDYGPGMKVPVKGMVTILDIGAASCIPCKMMAPILEKLEKKYDGKAAVIFLDVRYHKETAISFGINGIPTQIFYDKKGNEVYRHLGFMSEDAIVAQFKKMGVE